MNDLIGFVGKTEKLAKNTTSPASSSRRPHARLFGGDRVQIGL